MIPNATLPTSREPGKLPLGLGLGYLFFTVLMFLVGPLDWPLERYWPVLAYVSLLFGVMTLFFVIGGGKEGRHRPLKRAKTIYIVGALSAILLLLPTAIVYTGRWPWQVLEALADQNEAYLRLQRLLIETQGQRAPIALIRSATAPFTFAVLPLGILYWSRLSATFKMLLVGTVLSTLILSALRGTTRELADVVVVGGSAYVISIYRSNRTGSLLAAHWHKIVLGLIMAMAVLMALISRTEARHAHVTKEVCISGLVCSVYGSEFYDNLPPRVLSGMGAITGYFSQGYFGLALALERDFDTTWGLGHSPPLMQLYESYTGDYTLNARSYTTRVEEVGWSNTHHWSTMVIWFANDIGFIGVAFLMALIGFVWARSWVDATRGRDDRAAIFFCIIMMVIFYFPANNQMMLTWERYAVTVFWTIMWLGSRKRSVRVGPQGMIGSPSQ